MSAIAGMMQLHTPSLPDGSGKKMMQVLRKYPADQVGLWQKGPIFLGCHVQWVTPESVQEHLPFVHEGAGLAIASDAVIDNRPELFEALGVPRVDRSQIGDAELILMGWQKWREDLPKHLVGDFAFVIWDEPEHVLFGARDFSGTRTLYYTQENGRFAFCTVMAPLFTLPGMDKKVNLEWLSEYLAIPDMVDSSDPGSTIYQMIHQLPPAHYFIIRHGILRLSQYCRISEPSPLKLKTDEDYLEAFKEVFGRAVSDRLRSCRGIGSNLSGGLDSSSVVGFASRSLREHHESIDAFSYVPEKEFVDWTPRRRLPDERKFIHMTVRHCGNIREHLLDFKGRNPFSEINDWLDIIEGPYKYFENSFWVRGIFEASQKRNLGVLLNGARGNFTVSWGSATEYYAHLMRHFHWIRLCREVNQYSRNVGAGRRKVYLRISGKAFPEFHKFASSGNLADYPILIDPGFAKETDVYRRLESKGYDLYLQKFSSNAAFRRHHFEQPNAWTPTGTCNTKLSLYYGVKDRDPTNDLRVIRFCLSLPMEQFVCSGMDRALIRRSTAGIIPDEVRLNQKVRGIQAADMIHRMTPLWHEWLADVDQMMHDSAVTGLFNRTNLNEAVQKMQPGPKPEFAYDLHFKLLMRALIVYRFLKKVGSSRLGGSGKPINVSEGG